MTDVGSATRIFASSCAYPVKGFSSLPEAFGNVKTYPDATLAVRKELPDGEQAAQNQLPETFASDLAEQYGVGG